MNAYYPIYLDLRGRNALIVGGGPIATGKASGMLAAGARVTVIAPDASAEIGQWAREAKLIWHARAFREGDLDGHFIVVAATDDRALNALVYQMADAQGRVANAADDLDNCNFIAPAVAQRGPLQVAVSTSGASPALAKQLRDQIAAEVLTEDNAALAEFLGRWRPAVKDELPTYQRRQAFWEGVLDSCLPQTLAQCNADAAISGTAIQSEPAGRALLADALMRELLRRTRAPGDASATCALHCDRAHVCAACKGV